MVKCAKCKFQIWRGEYKVVDGKKLCKKCYEKHQKSLKDFNILQD